jgi:hypothetical protein
MTHSIVIHNAQQLGDVLQSFSRWAKARVTAGRRISLSVEEERRNLPQNAKLHACLTEISRQVTWAGRKWDVETWKRLTVASWCRARGEALLTVPAIDGQGVDIVFQRTSKLSKAECSELLDFIQAWGAEQGVLFSKEQ